MNALDRFAHIAAASGNLATRNAPVWHRYHDAATGLSFETPVEFVVETPEKPFDALVEGRMTLPFVFDVMFLASRDFSDASLEALARAMATQWMVDYDLRSGPRVQCVEYPGVDEAWALTATIEDEAGMIDYSWVTLRRDGKVGCLSVSCWSAEGLGREAWFRTLGSVRGDSPV